MTFREALSEAIREFVEHGFDNPLRLADWMRKLRTLAKQDSPSPEVLQERMRSVMEMYFRRGTSITVMRKKHPGVPLFTLHRIKPQLRSELGRRVQASVDLIKLNRDQAIEKTLQRFAGWASSVPAGGSRVTNKRDVKSDIAKSLRQMSFEERRVAIDQGHKLMASVDAVIAQQTGTIAALWRSHWRQPGYDYRPDHKERDGKVYAIRGNWAMEKGLMNKGAGYLDEMTQAAQEPFCFPGDTLVPFADEVEVAYRRWYCGELAVISTASGKTLRATLNHPILTTRGWVAAGQLKEGDDVIEIADDVIQPIVCKAHDNCAVPSISEVFDSVSEVGKPSRIAGHGHQFHGDGSEGDVDIVWATRKLSFGRVSPDAKRVDNLGFSLSNLRASSICTFQLFADRCAKFAARLVRRFGSALVLLRRLIGRDKNVGFDLIASSSTCTANGVGNGFPSDAEFQGQGKDAFTSVMPSHESGAIKFSEPGFAGSGKTHESGLVEVGDRDIKSVSDALVRHSLSSQVTNIVSINRVDFAGHVFNLQTRDGWYSAGGIITHNCRCFVVSFNNLRDLPDDMLTAKGRAELERVRLKA